MIFLASRPREVFLATCDRNMSPVACEQRPNQFQKSKHGMHGPTRWQTQNLSLILGACVPFPAIPNVSHLGSPNKLCCENTSVPAPGGPIKTILTPLGGFDTPCSNLASSCCTRDSSLCTRSLRLSTISSVIGAIAAGRGGRLT
jgi:hypothetical protein